MLPIMPPQATATSGVSVPPDATMTTPPATAPTAATPRLTQPMTFSVPVTIWASIAS
ncbi:hypothetical protein D3C87_1179420 [compost metagenome]|nr:hypothetical protein LMG19282_05489 [Cupriavidus campinensis]